MVIARALAFMFPDAQPFDDYIVEQIGGGQRIAKWNLPVPQPTEAELAATIASPAFITWLAEHGGDLALTLRRQAKEALDRQSDEQQALTRAHVLVNVDEFNNIRQWITSFKASVAASTSLADLKTRVAALPNMPDRTPLQARNAIKAKITAGEADT